MNREAVPAIARKDGGVLHVAGEKRKMAKPTSSWIINNGKAPNMNLNINMNMSRTTLGASWNATRQK